MKFTDRFRKSALGFSKALGRFPLTAALLVIIAVCISLMINNENMELDKYLAAATVGVFISIVLEMIYERFGTKKTHKYLTVAIAMIITLGYYLLIMGASELSMEIVIRTGVLILALAVGFLWIPSIKSKITFNESFMAGFKAFFIAALFSGVLLGGTTLIYATTNQLLFDVPEELYAHTSNVVIVLFAAIYFLSLIPKYPDNSDKETSCPKFLEILISYIIVPLASLFTLILLIYIVMNIGGSFWKNDLLEVMLVSYVVVVIIIYVLASRIQNVMAKLFRMIFPKILIFIVLFQTVNSFMRIGTYGLTYGRYYVILFGIFALIAGIVFSLKPVEKNGIAAMALIICVGVSLLPPIDAFNLSKESQISVLENTLIENGMLKDGEIVPNENLSDESKDIITASTEYIYRMDYFDEVKFLGADFEYYEDFKEVFGFSRYEKIEIDEGEDFYIHTNLNGTVDINGYDFMLYIHLSYSDEYDLEDMEYDYIKDGEEYHINIYETDDDVVIMLKDDEGKELISINGIELTEGFKEFYTGESELNADEAKVEFENDYAGMKILVQYMEASTKEDDYTFNSEIYIMVKIK